MSCARNLVKACEKGCFGVLYKGTSQIFGMCPVHGVKDTSRLFKEYRRIVVGCLRNMPRDTLVKHLHDIVWEPGQRTLMRLVGFNAQEWRSMLTVPTY